MPIRPKMTPNDGETVTFRTLIEMKRDSNRDPVLNFQNGKAGIEPDLTVSDTRKCPD